MLFFDTFHQLNEEAGGKLYDCTDRAIISLLVNTLWPNSVHFPLAALMLKQVAGMLTVPCFLLSLSAAPNSPQHSTSLFAWNLL